MSRRRGSDTGAAAGNEDDGMTELFDVNCRIGAGPTRQEGAIASTKELLALMDEFHVTNALVHHSVAQYSDPLLGNGMVLSETAANGRLLPQWAVLPPLWDLFPSPEDLIGQMKENGVKTVRLFPAQYKHSLKRYAAGELLDALAQCNIPAFIALDQLADWDALYELCAAYPAGRFVLCRPGYRCLRSLVPILDACDNLWVETSDLFMHDGFKDLCRYQGAGRFLFGSGVPDASLAASASQLLLSDISDEEKRMIGAENIRKLLSEVSF